MGASRPLSFKYQYGPQRLHIRGIKFEIGYKKKACKFSAGLFT